jgi:hypothetical protein
MNGEDVGGEGKAIERRKFWELKGFAQKCLTNYAPNMC